MDFREKLKISFNSTAALLIIIAITALINVLSSRHFIREDLTTDQRYTVSDSTKQIVAKLDDKITLKVYYSQKFPINLKSIFAKIKDLLSEYEAYSKGKLQIKYLDPTDNSGLQEEAKTLGIPQLPFQIREGDQTINMMGYLGIAILYGDKKETIPIIQSLDTLEYELTASIKKVIATKIKKIGFLAGHGEHKITKNNNISASAGNQGDYELIAEALRKNYDIEEINLTEGKPIQGIDTLIVAGPKDALSERDTFEMDQFIMNGGTIVFLVDQINTENIMMPKEITDTSLNNLLGNFGISVNKDLIMEVLPAYNVVASFSIGMFNLAANYSFWPKLIRQNFSLDNPIMAKVDSLILPWSSTLNINKDAKYQIKILASSSNQAASQTGSFNLDPQNQPAVKKEDLKQYPMAVLISGKFKSYYLGKPIPPTENANAGTDKTTEGNISVQENQGDKNRKVINEVNKEGQILVIGNSAFIADNFLQMFPQNGEFFLNAVDYLTLDPALIAIRAKQIYDQPLKALEKSDKIIIKAIGIGLMPILVIIYGIFRAWKRKRNKYASII